MDDELKEQIDKALLDMITKHARCTDDNGNDITSYYTELIPTIPVNDDGTKTYKGIKYIHVDSGWEEADAYDLVMVWPTEEIMLHEIDRKLKLEERAKDYLDECGGNMDKAMFRAAMEKLKNKGYF